LIIIELGHIISKFSIFGTNISQKEKGISREKKDSENFRPSPNKKCGGNQTDASKN
jgi:hypothetical protein